MTIKNVALVGLYAQYTPAATFSFKAIKKQKNTAKQNVLPVIYAIG